LDVLVADTRIFYESFPDDVVYVGQNSFWQPVPGYPAPIPPPMPGDTEGFIPEDGVSPPAGQILSYLYVLRIPEFEGKNQARLRGLVDYDVRWIVTLLVWRENDAGETPEVFAQCGQPFVSCTDIRAIENSANAPPNAKPFADAGPDQLVASGQTVVLDGSRTFDSFNVGFDTNSANIFEKDEIEYTWEWISGPERVEPITRDAVGNPAKAEVTLNELGIYVYRLTADDGVNALPTTDSVVIEVVAVLPENRAPVARASGPARQIQLGEIITLDGTGSFDPDGDPLGFLWQQTDEIGGRIPSSDFGRLFQPLSGLESPVSRWQAIQPGDFYFRLLVNDGEFVATDRISVEVVDSTVAGIIFTNPDGIASLRGESPASPQPSVAEADSSADQPAGNPLPACGAGMLPILFAPLALLFVRGRVRRG
jgi:hypothetical protein